MCLTNTWTTNYPLFSWSEISSQIQEKPSFKTDVCVPTRISGGDELTFSENTQPLLRVLNYGIVFWPGQAFCTCDVQISIFSLLPIFWQISPIHFLFCFRMKKSGALLNCCIFRLFQVMSNIKNISVVGPRLKPRVCVPQPRSHRAVCACLCVGRREQRKHLDSLPWSSVGSWSYNDGAKDVFFLGNSSINRWNCGIFEICFLINLSVVLKIAYYGLSLSLDQILWLPS